MYWYICCLNHWIVSTISLEALKGILQYVTRCYRYVLRNILHNWSPIFYSASSHYLSLLLFPKQDASIRKTIRHGLNVMASWKTASHIDTYQIWKWKGKANPVAAFGGLRALMNMYGRYMWPSPLTQPHLDLETRSSIDMMDKDRDGLKHVWRSRREGKYMPVGSHLAKILINRIS